MEKELLERLLKILEPNQIRAKYIDRVSFASDAGFYYLVPKCVVQPTSKEQIIALFKVANELNTPLVFRAGGTSLSGQSITDGILVDISKNWNRISFENNGELVRVMPGITGLMVNNHLKKYKRKIGPDPSSINAAMMGGILSNNASGMCCGVALNAYHTTKHIEFIMPNGSLYNTENKEDYVRFENESVFEELLSLKSQIENNEALKAKIREKYKYKNTVGYGLNSFVDYDHPLDVFAHLLIGGEGTLAFISEVKLQTVPDYPHKSTSLLFFDDIFAACQAIIPLTDAGAVMVELMDRASLRSVENMEGMPEIIMSLPSKAAALLVEFQEESEQTLDDKISGFLQNIESFKLLHDVAFTKDPRQQALYWKVRKGLFPAVGAVRVSGSTVILEDIAFPVAQLGHAIIDIQNLFVKHEYKNGIIFGHAKDGNIHFVVTQTFNTDNEVERYGRFMDDIVNLVVSKYNGSLKAEHGTGRNMSPFVETEWGSEAYAIMKKIKHVVDPSNILNPGVIINDDQKAHLKNLKKLPTVEQEVDKCIECGFCEPKCPSKDYTSSPRRRIVTRRVLQSLKQEGKRAEFELLNSQFQFDGLDTCAVDGLCASDCPVGINTGDLVKRLRVNNHTKVENFIAKSIANNFEFFQKTVVFALKCGFFVNNIFGEQSMYRLTSFMRRFSKAIPLWESVISPPPVLKNILVINNNSAKLEIVYFPSCISRMLGTYEGKEKNIMETFLSVCSKANVSVKILSDYNSKCCGQLFSSKGFDDAFEIMANKTIEQLWVDTMEGQKMVVIDVSSCAYTLHNMRKALNEVNCSKFDRLKILDSVDFLHDYLIVDLDAKTKKSKIVVHPVCSLQKIKSESKFEAIATKYSEELIVPINAGCCGMAGDRGFLIPELTVHATFAESKEVKNLNAEAYYSSTKTCEMAMSIAVGKNYESLLYLVDECS